jgi:hypothetical protein
MELFDQEIPLIVIIVMFSIAILSSTIFKRG